MAKTGEQYYADYQSYLEKDDFQGAGLHLILASVTGYVKAQAELGYKYLNGILFPKDYDNAMRWLTAASDQGDLDSIVNLATMYLFGYGTKTDGARARELLQKAVDAEYPAAGRFMGISYEKGIGLPKDYEEAVKWYRWGAERGDAGSAFLLGDCYENGSGVKKDLNEARRWYEKAAEGDGVEAETARKALAALKE